MKTYQPVLPHFRNRWATAMQLIAMLSMVFQPLTVSSSWSDANGDFENDTWTGNMGTNTLEDLDLQSTDIDGDNATNSEEAYYNSDPFVFDTDADGLDDGTEIHLAIQQSGKNYSLTSWDSNGDAVSDYDDFYGFFGVTYPGGQLPSYTGATYSDYDGDGQKNHEDPYPEDPQNNDGDQDGINDSIDPDTASASNYSEHNQITWGSDAVGDADLDRILNYWDPLPYTHLDTDNDGYLDADDPVPESADNYSPTNETSWYNDVKGNADNDSILNFWDATPWGEPDTDSDGIIDAEDPAPNDATNASTINGIAWYDLVLGDADMDETVNYYDSSPYPDPGPAPEPDSDGDGLYDSSDPAPSDSTNYSLINGVTWYYDVLADADADGNLNFYDETPYPEADTDGDGFTDSQDPAPEDDTNTSPYNGMSWYSDALGDNDGDGYLNFFDYTPWIPPPTDVDQDGLEYDEEDQWGTSDYDVDSDDDGLTDYEEVRIYQTVPTDKFYLSRQNGWGELYTDYQLADLTDTDLDTLPDRVESHYAVYGLDPNTPEDSWRDIDGNGINNRTQYSMGIALDSDMDRYDADMDGLSDVFEDFYGLNKQMFSDAVADPDEDGVLNYEEMKLLLNPTVRDTLQTGSPLGDLLQLMISVRYPDPATTPPTDDTDTNGIPDWADAYLLSVPGPGDEGFVRRFTDDLDGDGMGDEWEYQFGRWRFLNGLNLRRADNFEDNDNDGLINGFEAVSGTSPIAGNSNDNLINDPDEDPDGDGLTHKQEQLLGMNPLSNDSDRDGILDGAEDADGDGITNAAEFNLGTSPVLHDSDGDDVGDGLETQVHGTDPLDKMDSIFAYTGLRLKTAMRSMH